MILIPAGEFLMGSDPLADPKAQDEEQPQHLLFLPDYYLAKMPVTNAQYRAFIQSTGYQPPKHWDDGKPLNDRLNHPVVHISWYDAIAYCNWLAKITGKPYRLPSEAEWEKGARGNDGRIYPWGNEWDASRCNTRENGPGDTTLTGAYPNGVSPYQLLDMAGNIWEWTSSIWGKDAIKPDFKYPYRPDDGRENLGIGIQETRRVVKGGSFDYNEDDARCAVRYRSRPISKGDYRGFRLAMSSF
ncbi:MAG: formylglycine-generating enzyme family protein [Anaerolineales bacterium]|nr:formylglycine-generating enzyme family protein [Anaerolineales bacterium]